MYTSTRSHMQVHASHAILKGLAPDGGLFVLNTLDKSLFKDLDSMMTIKDVARLVLTYFLDDFSSEAIESIIEKSYNAYAPEVYTFDHVSFGSVLNLYHGPTFAFKDLALQMLPHMFEEAKKIQNIHKKTVILTATSGDTGGAALSGFSMSKDTSVIVLYPAQGVSEFQARQMNQFQSERCHIFGVDGNFDDCQTLVKDIFQSVNHDHILLSSANSINIGRIIAQVIYYVSSYLTLKKEGKLKENQLLDVVVPSGNFGNIYAAYLSKQLGLPLGDLVVASNKNNVLTDVFKSYTYSVDRLLYQTISPSMDIIVSSNLERYFYHQLNDPLKVSTLMQTLQEKRSVDVSFLKHQKDMYAYYLSEDHTQALIKSFYETYNILIDPHTAVGYGALLKHKKKASHYQVIVSTASPYKFSNHVLHALEKRSDTPLYETIDTLKSYDTKPFDPRIKDVTVGSVKEHLMSKSSVKSYVIEVMMHDL